MRYERDLGMSRVFALPSRNFVCTQPDSARELIVPLLADADWHNRYFAACLARHHIEQLPVLADILRHLATHDRHRQVRAKCDQVLASPQIRAGRWVAWRPGQSAGFWPTTAGPQNGTRRISARCNAIGAAPWGATRLYPSSQPCQGGARNVAQAAGRGFPPSWAVSCRSSDGCPFTVTCQGAVRRQVAPIHRIVWA